MQREKAWFRAKKYGWGWCPISWQGWLVLFVYLFLVISLFRIIDSYSHSGSDTLINFALPFIGLTSLLLSVCYVKGEWPKWQWGGVSSSWPESRKILAEIKKAKSILLHCHPSPDPDSVGSSLAMKFALEQLGKKVTLIQGDSETPEAFMHFPGAKEIVKKNFSEVNLQDYDLFISEDSASPEMVSRKHPPTFPLSIKSIVIDHHATNKGYGDINLIDVNSPSVTYILFKLFKDWGIKIDYSIALNLFMGIYSDTGGFRYPPSDHEILQAASDLAKIAKDYSNCLFIMDNSEEKDSIYAKALAFSSVKTYFNDSVAISAISNEALKEKNIHSDAISEGHIASTLKAVIGWNLGICAVEIEPGKVKLSMRTRDPNKFDVSKLAAALGGGGHKAASGAVLSMSIDEAVKKIVDTVKITYNI